MASATYSFACPHCGAVNPVAEAQLGGVVPCAACARPFRSDIPAGKPLGALGGPAALSSQADSPTNPVASQAGNSAARPADQGFALRLHPAVWRLRFAATCFDMVLVVGGLACGAFAVALWRKQPIWAYFFLAGGGAMILVSGSNLLAPWVKSRGETLEVTAASTRWTQGWFKRRSVEIRHDAVRAVEVEQTLFQRVLGIGTLTLASDGSDADEIVMRGVPGVQAVAARIRELQAANK